MRFPALGFALLLLAGCRAPEEAEVFAPDFAAHDPVPPPGLPADSTGDPGILPVDGAALDLSEEQAVLLALQRNRDLRVERLAPAIAGTFEAIVSVEDELITVYGGGALRWFTAIITMKQESFPGKWLGRILIFIAQRAAERLHARMRHDLLRMDEHLADALAFAGRPE